MIDRFETFRSINNRLRPDGARRILIAEDYVDLARVMESLLRHCGFDVKVIHDGRAVLELAREFLPHYLLLDIRLPGMSGYEVATLIRHEESLNRCVIMGISAYRAASACDPMIENYFDHYLIKPFELDVLLSILDGP
jgi:DNA-binding response OmpR family regulator